MEKLVTVPIICLSLLVLATTGTVTTTSQDMRPNIVLVLTDDQGFGDIGFHGNDRIRTPNLDRFASQGVELTRFYVSPVCAPTRASLMTGRYYYRTGVIHTSRGGAKMHGEEVTIAELLAGDGYRTGIFGKWHLGDNAPMRPQDQGFLVSLIHKSGGITQTPDKPNSYFDPILWRNGQRIKAEGYCTDVFFNAALEFIEKNQHEPFFVYLSTNAPHTPLQVDPRYSQQYEVDGLDATTAKIYGMISNIDENFGSLLSRLEELGLSERTVVIFMTDNGPQQRRYNAGLRDRKTSVYEGGIRVPFLIRWPGHLDGSYKVDQIAAHIDIAPTLLSIADIRKPEGLHMDGRNLLPAIRSASAEMEERSLVFQCHRGLTPQRYQNCAVVTSRYKLVANPGLFSDESFDAEPGFELYDLQVDSTEKVNLAERHPEIVRRLRSEYDRWFEDVRNTRKFTPGLIRIGTSAENPTHLCRYQDANYREGLPNGWSVEVARSARYEITVNRGEQQESGRVYVSWAGEELVESLGERQETAVFQLGQGVGVLDVWFEQEGQGRVIVSNNTTVGDVTLRRLD